MESPPRGTHKISKPKVRKQHSFLSTVSGLKPGRVTRVIQVIRVTFSPGQAGLTRIIKYPGLTRILHCITCVDNGIWQ